MSTVRCLLIGAAAAAVLVLLAPALGQATSDDPAPATFTTRLQPPWSLVTVTAHTTAGALVDDDPSVVALYRWDPDTARFDTWRRDDPAGAGSLRELRAADALWVLSTAATSLTQPPFHGGRVLELRAGWTLVAWTGDPAPAGAVADALRAERLFGYDADRQRYVNLLPALFGPRDDLVLGHGEVVWAYRSRSGPAVIPARTGVRLELALHAERFPDGLRQADELPRENLSISTALSGPAPGPPILLRSVAPGRYVADLPAPGVYELRIGGDGLKLIVRTPHDVRLPTEPLSLEIRADTTLALGVADGVLISPVGGEEAGTRPFGAPNPGFGLHLGIDYFVPAGHRVVAPVAGVVTWAGQLADDNCTTRAIAIAGPADGLAWLLHLDAISVTAGDRVGYGDMLGTVIAAADDGCIVGLGDHVHLAYRIPDAAGLFRSVDPAPFFIPTDR